MVLATFALQKVFLEFNNLFADVGLPKTKAYLP